MKQEQLREILEDKKLLEDKKQLWLEEILENHKLWLEGNPKGKRAVLRIADLKKEYLRYKTFRYADLVGVDFRYADLRYADFGSADLKNADFRGANLRRTNFEGADITGANFVEANIDFSSFTLWCGSLDVKVDARIARQIAYHLCRLDCDDEEFKEVREKIKNFANKFHRVEDCGEIK